MNDGNELMCPYCKKVVVFQPEEDSIDCPYCGKQIAKKLAEEQKKMAEEELKEKQNPAWLTASVKKKDGKHCPCCGVEAAGFACCPKCGLRLWMLGGKTEAEQNELIRKHKKAAKDLAKKAADFNKTVSKLTELNKTMNIPPGVLASTIGKHNFSTCFWGIGMGLGIVNGLVCWEVQCFMMKNAHSLSDIYFAWIVPMAVNELVLIWQLYLGAKLAGTKGLVLVFLGWLLFVIPCSCITGVANGISKGLSSQSLSSDRSYY